MYKVGIIGLGWIGMGISGKTSKLKGDTHYDVYRQCLDTEIVAYCDKRNNYGCFEPYYTNHLDMVRKENLDIVSVCTPPRTHCQIVCDVAPYVKAILCEKPIALTLEDADKMIDVCHQHGTILQINHQRAFTIPKFRFSRDIIDTGSHMFELLTRLFGNLEKQDGKYWWFGHTPVEIEYVDTSNLTWTESHIFEFDVTHNAEPMILASVNSLVDCLRRGVQARCSGEHGREALRLALLFKEQFENLSSSNHS